MTRDDILYWFRRWNDEGLYSIDIEGAEEDGLIDYFASLNLPNAIALFGTVERCLSD